MLYFPKLICYEQAVDSINKIVEEMPPAVVNEELVHLIEDLYRDEWFTPRVSACYLIPKAYAKIAEVKDETSMKILRDCFFDLCKDDTPMGRRAAAKNLSAFFAIVDDIHISLFISQFEDFINSEDVFST